MLWYLFTFAVLALVLTQLDIFTLPSARSPQWLSSSLASCNPCTSWLGMAVCDIRIPMTVNRDTNDRKTHKYHQSNASELNAAIRKVDIPITQRLEEWLSNYLIASSQFITILSSIVAGECFGLCFCRMSFFGSIGSYLHRSKQQHRWLITSATQSCNPSTPMENAMCVNDNVQRISIGSFILSFYVLQITVLWLYL